ncbi:MAG: hypothetical protein UY04_C0003G0028 [Parcubacteria group bacterium GW2011_GWA2_47_7]|nr:MAG: hypothetical protein UY04_C0003G0028 [Parcubacteria group bacterium GW2011_GWA2_47_7]
MKPILAKRLKWGNEDPQHGKEGRRSSAIQQSLYCPLPPKGARLVTIRPDQDSFGAFAIMEERAHGNFNKINIAMVFRIGAVDRHGWLEADKRYSHRFQDLPCEKEAKAIQFFINSKSYDLPTTILAIRGILTGDKSIDVEFFASELDKQQELERKLLSRMTAVRLTNDIGYVIAPGRYRDGRNLANRNFKVGIVFDPAYTREGGGTRRISIVRQEGYFDRDGCENALNREEARVRTEIAFAKEEKPVSIADLEKAMCEWGGSANLICSPHGVGCETVLPNETVIRIVLEYHENGIVSGSLEKED